MSDEHTDHTQSRPALAWDHPVSILITVALMSVFGLLVQFGFAHLPWFQRFQERHGFWTQLLFAWVSIPLIFIFRRRQRLTDQLRFREDLRAGRVMRMSLAMRCAVMLIALVMVVSGSLIEHGTLLLMLGGPVLLLFAVEEFNIILRPGNSVVTDPRDELLAFFKARSMQVGYAIAILSMAILCLVSVFATRYVGALMPVGLTLSLLAPSLCYSRLDRRAGSDA